MCPLKNMNVIIIIPIKNKNRREPVPTIQAPLIFLRIDFMTIKNDAITVLVTKMKSEYFEKAPCPDIIATITTIKMIVEIQKYFSKGRLKRE